MSFAWLADSPQAEVLHAVPCSATADGWFPWPGLPPCNHCVDRLIRQEWKPDPSRPPGHYTTPRPQWLDDNGAVDESPIILIPATPVDDLDASPWVDIPAMPLGAQSFANVATQYGAADVTVTYARAIIPPHTTKTDNPTTTPAYMVESFAVRFHRAPSPHGTFPHRAGVQGYAMWERKHKKDDAAWSSAGAGYRNHMTQGQFPGVTEVARLLKEGLL